MFGYRAAYYLKSRKPDEADTIEFVKWQEKMSRIENLAGNATRLRPCCRSQE